MSSEEPRFLPRIIELPMKHVDKGCLMKVGKFNYGS